MDAVPDLFCIFSIFLPSNCRDGGAFGFSLWQRRNWVRWSSLHFVRCYLARQSSCEVSSRSQEWRPRQNVLRIVPIFTIDNNHYLALGFIILARLAQFEFWTLCVKMGGKKWQMFNIQTRKYVIRRSVWRNGTHTHTEGKQKFLFSARTSLSQVPVFLCSTSFSLFLLLFIHVQPQSR